MAMTYFFKDPEGRKYAILKAGRKKVIAWKSTSKGKWFVAPFVVNMWDTWWVAKEMTGEGFPKVPGDVVKEIEKKSFPSLRYAKMKQIAERHGLLRKSADADLQYELFVHTLASRAWSDEILQERMAEHRGSILKSMVGAANLELCDSILKFYSDFKPQTVKVMRRMLPTSRRRRALARKRKIVRSKAK